MPFWIMNLSSQSLTKYKIGRLKNDSKNILGKICKAWWNRNEPISWCKVSKTKVKGIIKNKLPDNLDLDKTWVSDIKNR